MHLKALPIIKMRGLDAQDRQDRQDRPRFQLGEIRRTKTAGAGKFAFKQRAPLHPSGVPNDAWVGVQKAFNHDRHGGGSRKKAVFSDPDGKRDWKSSEHRPAKVGGLDKIAPRAPTEVRAVVSGTRRFTVFWKSQGALDWAGMARGMLAVGRLLGFGCIYCTIYMLPCILYVAFVYMHAYIHTCMHTCMHT